jgi:membrane peptidoglycan carboxypeptidase
MTSVHGIRVTGGSFPAQIWRLFMSSAIGQLEDVDFPEPKDWPEWSDFERGQYARSFGYYTGSGGGGSDDDDEPETTEQAETTNAETTPMAPPAGKPAPPPKPPATTAAPPPPPTTTPPPPPTEAPPIPTEPEITTP